MKQKNGNIKNKPLKKELQKPNTIKKAKNAKEADGLKSKKLLKKTAPPAKVVPPKKVEEDDEESDNDEDDSGTDLGVGEQVVDESEESASDEDAEEEDEVDNDENEDLVDGEGESEEENGVDAGDDAEEDESDDDDEPSEAPIVKKIESSSKAKGGIPKIKTCTIPPTVPANQVIVVKNLPTNVKQIDIVEVFAKFGTIDIIHTLQHPHGPVASIAFENAEAAESAIAATNKKAQINGSVLKVANKKSKSKKGVATEDGQKTKQEQKTDFKNAKDRLVLVRNIEKGTTEEEIREHFKDCGTIESLKLVTKHKNTHAYLTFSESSEAQKAKELHNSVLNDTTIGVLLKNDETNRTSVKDEKRTVLVKNKQNFKSYPGEKLKKIFGKCGEIEEIDILCAKCVLAFITFKEEKAAKKAMALNGSTTEDTELEIEQYNVLSGRAKTTIFVQNVKPGVTEKEIRDLFEVAGEIQHVFIKGGFSIIKFKDSDGFCKSFLLNESLLHGQMIFIEPHSEKKHMILKNQQKLQPKGKRQRPHNNFGKYSPAKKFKKEE